MNIGLSMLAVGAILAASVGVAFGAAKTGLPVLVAFLGLGMVLGSDGPGGIEFSDAKLAREVGVVSLVAILYEGGLSTSWRRLREVAAPAVVLSTLGVVVTAGVTGVAARAFFDLTWSQALLLGAVVASTDAAAVFATLRTTRLRRSLARTLEAESGANDPVAIALTLGLISVIEKPDYRIGDLTVLLIRQLGLGLLVGVVLGIAATWLFGRIPASIGPFVPVASVATAALAYGAADAIHGSGFLAVYLVGLAVGSTPSRYRGQLVTFHTGVAYVAQVALFIVLGLLVFPSQLPDVALASLGVTAVLVLLARPLAVWASVAPLRRFTTRERALLGWAGLRGAVPIVLGTFVLSSHVSARGHDLQCGVLRRAGLDRAAGDDPRVARTPARPARHPAGRGAAPRGLACVGLAEPRRVHRGPGSLDRGCGGARARASSRDARGGGRAGRRRDPPTRQHDDPRGRPAVRPRPGRQGARGRGRLRAVAEEGLTTSSSVARPWSRPTGCVWQTSRSRTA